MNQEFEQFYGSIRNFSENDKCEINKKLRYKFYKKYLIILILCATICFSIYEIQWANWHFCAISRLLMVKICSIWDLWPNMYNEKCLFKKDISYESQFYFEENYAKCIACENYGKN